MCIRLRNPILYVHLNKLLKLNHFFIIEVFGGVHYKFSFVDRFLFKCLLSASGMKTLLHLCFMRLMRQCFSPSSCPASSPPHLYTQLKQIRFQNFNFQLHHQHHCPCHYLAKLNLRCNSAVFLLLCWISD